MLPPLTTLLNGYDSVIRDDPTAKPVFKFFEIVGRSLQFGSVADRGHLWRFDIGHPMIIKQNYSYSVARLVTAAASTHGLGQLRIFPSRANTFVSSATSDSG